MCQNFLELTLAILKPHIINQPHALKNIRSMIMKANFKVVGSKQQTLTKLEAAKFYEEHKEKFFYNRLVTFMTSGPSEFYILCKENAIKDWRELMGPTKVYKAMYTHPNSIRGLYGLSDTRNAAHGSGDCLQYIQASALMASLVLDSTETAQREIGLFFPQFNMDAWFRDEEKLFKLNKIEFIEDRFVHSPIRIK